MHDPGEGDRLAFPVVGVIVQKYGGTSVAGPEEIKRVARRIVATAQAGNQVCAVVSAMGDTTDRLVELGRQISADPHPRELDMLLTAGERISMALVSMAINDLGLDAASFTGSQAGIVTDTTHGRAKIVEMRRARVHEALDEGKVAIVAGFQGVSTDKDVTTLGRGGSDTTAVALAAALEADVCEIYTDVEGVFTADPRIESGARKLAAVTYEEMLELAASGARVLMLRSVEYARNHGVKLHVRSSFNETEGTWVVKEGDVLEQAIISGVAHDTGEAKVTIREVPDRPGVAGRVFRPLADAGINIDMIVQNTSEQGHTDITFTLPADDLERAEPVLTELAESVGATGFVSDTDIAKVSVVGAGMRSHPGVAADVFEALADAEINIEIISTSAIRVSCVVRARDAERAVNVIHERLRLADDILYEVDEPSAAAG
jgi:aspartate kinase